MPFVRIGRADEFNPERMVPVGILGRRIGIFRETDGSWAAIELNCRHQKADLTYGRRRGDIVVCPLHSWEYDLRTGECLTVPDSPLRRFSIEVRDGEVFLSTTPQER